MILVPVLPSQRKVVAQDHETEMSAIRLHRTAIRASEGDNDWLLLTPYFTRLTAKLCASFLARDAFLRTNRRAIDMMFVCLSVCLSVCLGRACIVIIRCILARI